MLRPASTWSLILSLTPALFLGRGAFPQEKAPAAPAAFEFDPAALEGPDEELGRLAAYKLIEAIASRTQASATDPAQAGARSRHLEYLRRHLDPARLEASDGAASRRVAARVARILGLLVQERGPVLPEAPDLLIGILGRGPPEVRSVVVEALARHLEWERKSAGAEAGAGSDRRPMTARVGSIVAHNNPPPASVLHDALDVLWRADGKAFVEYAVRGLLLNREHAPERLDDYLTELRERLGVDFPRLEDWEVWLRENRERSFAEILLAIKRRNESELTAAWRRVLRRLQAAGDAERVLAEIQETLEGAGVPELRLAAVAELGPIADWLRDLKLQDAPNAPASEVRLQLLSRACTLLLRCGRREFRAHEPRAVERAVFVALRKYQPLLERSPELLGEVSAFLQERLEKLVGRNPAVRPENREDLIEVVRTAGALRIEGARQSVESLLDALPAPAGESLELKVAAAQALGRLGQGEVDLATAKRFLRLFDTAPPPAGAAEDVLRLYRELRRTCVLALNGRPAGPEVRELQRGLFLRVLFGEKDKDLRIPAILGLGTLARGDDTQALESLVKVVEQAGSFETAELIAALDSMAYVGGRRALNTFISLLDFEEKLAARDRVVAEHLWRKLVTLAASEGPQGLAWALEELERRAFEKDSLALADKAVKLTEEKTLAPLLALPEPEALKSEDLQRLLRLRLVYVRLLRATGGQESARRALTELAQYLEKHPAVAEAAGSVRETVARLGKTDAAMRALEKNLAEGAGPNEVLGAMKALLAAAGGPLERWETLRLLERGLTSPELAAKPAYRILPELLSEHLRSEAAAGVFQGMPEGHRERALARLKDLAAALKNAPEPPAPAKPPSASDGGSTGG